MKLRVPGSVDGKEVSFAPSVTSGDIPPLVGNDHLIPWGCSIHLYPDECRLEIPSRGIDAKLLVTTLNHILVNLADFAGTEEPDHDVWTSKRGRDSEETGTDSETIEGIEETITDPEEVPAKRTRRGVPRKNLEPQGGSGQDQPTWNNPAPPTTDASGQYQPTENDQTIKTQLMLSPANGKHHQNSGRHRSTLLSIRTRSQQLPPT